LLAALVIPGPGETLGGLDEVGSRGVDVARVPGSAHGHIGELAATAVVEDMRDFDRRSLGPMSGDGIAVGEAVCAYVVEPHLKLAATSTPPETGTGPSPPVSTSSFGASRRATRDRRAIIG
jgi:hypothetical protein